MGEAPLPNAFIERNNAACAAGLRFLY